jgi:ParB family chromosome partitioning protein
MSEKRRALGRGLGALIPSAPSAQTATRPVDVFFKDNPAAPEGSPPVATRYANGQDAVEAGASPGTSNGYGAHPAGVDSLNGKASSPNAESGATAPDLELAPVPGASFAELPVDSIRPNPRQPRSVFDEDDMAELVNSIKEIGVLQPVVVRPIPDSERGGGAVRYELIMGERRWRASQDAGKETVPAIIKETTDDVLLRDALLENLHRSQLNPLEEAAAYQQLLEDFGCTQEELATRIHRSRPQISNTLRLLKLPPLVARRVAAGVISAGHARALLTLNDGAAMERLAQRIVAEGLSVRSVEEIVAVGSEDRPTKPRRPRAGTRHPQLDDVAASLADQLETRVAIALGQRKGKVTIEFASVEDLNRILDVMGLRGRQN